MQEIKDAYKNKGVNVIGILTDIQNSKRAIEIMSKNKADYINVLSHGKLNDLLNTLPGVPTSFILNNKGEILGGPMVGARDFKTLKKQIDFFLPQNSTTENKSLPISKLKFTSPSYTVKVNRTFKLTPYIFPSNAYPKELVWSSGNPSIASVDKNGIITGKKSGITIITVTAKNTIIKATCTIKIEK